MMFLFPAMLAGLLGLGVPTIIHLIARHRFPVQDFPSIRLLMREERTNVFAPKLVDVGQLLLRLAVLLLLVLAMSRLFGGWLTNEPAPRNVVVVLDCSASMRMLAGDGKDGGKTTLFDVAKKRAHELFSAATPPSQCALVTAGAEARVEGRGLTRLSSGMEGEMAGVSPVEALDAAAATDGTGAGLVRAMALACDAVRGRREVRSQIIVLTDMRQGAFETRAEQDLKRIAAARREMGAALEIILIDVSRGAADNMAVVDAMVRGGEVKVGDDAHVISRIFNSSDKEATAKVRLSVGNRREPAGKDVVIGPGAEAVVDLTSRVSRSVRTFAQVSIDPDKLPIDDALAVPLNVSDVRRVLIIDGSSQNTASAANPLLAGTMGGTAVGGRAAAEAETEGTINGATILRYVLNPGRELGLGFGTGIDSTIIAPEAIAGQTLSKFDAVILYDVSSLPDAALDDLDSFVREGRALLEIASGGTSAPNFNRSIAVAGGKHGALSPALLGNDRQLDVPLGVRADATAHPVLAPFKDPLAGDLSVIQVTKLRDISNMAPTASVMFATTAGQPLAVEMPRDRGRIVMLTFGLELDRGNIARTRVFPALVWRMMDYLTGRLTVRPPDVLTALTPAVLDVSEPTFAFASALELTPAETASETDASARPAVKTLRLPISADHHVLVPALAAGEYLLHKPRQGDGNEVITYARYVTVHADPRESDLTPLAADQPGMLFGAATRVVKVDDPTDLTPRGGEFWKIFVMLLVVAYAAEALIGWILSVRRERQRALEQAGVMTAEKSAVGAA